jgi:hypothetical protein
MKVAALRTLATPSWLIRWPLASPASAALSVFSYAPAK